MRVIRASFSWVGSRAAKDTEALEQEIAMLSERFGEAAGEARAKGKALIEKETLLDAVTAQVEICLWFDGRGGKLDADNSNRAVV